MADHALTFRLKFAAGSVEQGTVCGAKYARSPDDLLFATREGTPISRNTFRTRLWLPAVTASGVDFNVRVHDLRTPTPPGSSPADPTSSP